MTGPARQKRVVASRTRLGPVCPSPGVSTDERDADPAGDSTESRRTEPSFAAVEAELDSVPDGVLSQARVTGVERVPASAVPAGFPGAFETDEACRLVLAAADSDETTETYLPWADDGPLGRLLALHTVEEPTDLHERAVLLRAAGGHWLPAVPEEPLRGDERAVYGILAGLVPSAVVALAGFFGFGTLISTPFLLLWFVGTFAVLPVSVYLDAWSLRTRTDWDGRPVVWAVLAAIPALSLVVAPYYLVLRQNARPLA